jgi:hypothetical protein
MNGMGSMQLFRTPLLVSASAGPRPAACDRTASAYWWMMTTSVGKTTQLQHEQRVSGVQLALDLKGLSQGGLGFS